MKQKQSIPAKRTGVAPRWIIGFSTLNLIVLSLVNYTLYFVSETWWVGSVLTYSPKVLFLIPTLILIVASAIWHRSTLGPNLISAFIVVVPVMGLSLPLELWLNRLPATERDMVLKVVSCNVQSYEPDFRKLLDEIELINPDIVALQEAFGDDERADEFFRDWYSVRQRQYRVFSRKRLSLISACDVNEFGGRLAGMIVQVETEAGPIVLANIHQMTARYGLNELDHESVITGKGTGKLNEFVGARSRESAAIRAAIDSARTPGPLVVCGDFNTPTSSILFQKHWGDLKSTFDAAAFGYGYTSPCQGSRFWPDNMPWARIDHILCSRDWTVRACEVGRTDGSDHRLIFATIVLQAGTAK